jgi:large subunit ribosomal protein L17
MRHRKAKGTLNLREPHRRALLRNQVIHLIEHGCLQTTKPHLKAVQRLAEKLVTLARDSDDFNARRRAKQLLPYKEQALVKLFKEIAPGYKGRPGGYTRIIPLGRRMSDTAPIGRIVWVETEIVTPLSDKK